MPTDELPHPRARLTPRQRRRATQTLIDPATPPAVLAVLPQDMDLLDAAQQLPVFPHAYRDTAFEALRLGAFPHAVDNSRPQTWLCWALEVSRSSWLTPEQFATLVSAGARASDPHHSPHGALDGPHRDVVQLLATHEHFTLRHLCRMLDQAYRLDDVRGRPPHAGPGQVLAALAHLGEGWATYAAAVSVALPTIVARTPSGPYLYQSLLDVVDALAAESEATLRSFTVLLDATDTAAPFDYPYRSLWEAVLATARLVALDPLVAAAPVALPRPDRTEVLRACSARRRAEQDLRAQRAQELVDSLLTNAGESA